MLTFSGGKRAPLGAFAAVLSIAAVACSSGSSGATGDGGGGPGSQGSTVDAALTVDAAMTGDGAMADDGGASEAGATACASLNYPVDPFATGMKKAGKAGIFTFVLVSADPSPPNDPQFNTWTVQVLDASGAPVPGATISLPNSDPALGWSFQKNPWMPNMSHGSSVVNTITNNGDGTATVKVYFSMTGLWQTFVVAQSGSQTDSATFSFCLP
jgi:hypothetical protein